MYLVDQLEEQKELQGEVEVSKFIKENNISDNAIVYRLVFSKKVFKTEVEVREYLDDKEMSDDSITESEAEFTVDIFAEYQMNPDTKVDVEIRRGVHAYAAEFMPFSAIYPSGMFNFSEKGEIQGGVDLSEVKTDSKLPLVIEVAKVAEGEHPQYGKLKITQAHLEAMVSNFKSKVTGVDLAVNEDHKKNEAFGWFKDVFLSNDKQTLYGKIAWNTKGTTALSEKQYRYFSPEFRFNYVHPHTAKEHGPTLLGGALTNYPFLKMDAITELSAKTLTKEKTMTEKEIELSTKNVELNGKVVELSNKVDTLSKTNVELSDKVKKLEEEAALEKRKASNLILFNEGKINKAQMDALNEGKSAYEVIALSDKMNTKAKGVDSNKEVIELSAKEKEMADKLGLTPEEFIAGM